jgi:hypothetical protein
MAARLSDGIDHFLPQFVSQLAQLCGFQAT